MPTSARLELDLHNAAPLEARVSPRPQQAKIWTAGWMILVCVIFGASGLVRVWQDWRYKSVKNQEIKPLFPLKKLDRKLGTWRALEDKEAVLDPQIARVAGSVDSLVRVYVDDVTGVAVTVLILYGRAETITGHTPQVCYPAAGYSLVDGGEIVGVPLGTGPSAMTGAFAGLVFAKKAGLGDREEVYYSFRHEDVWTPLVEGNWRILRFSPGVFKIQVQRKVNDTEYRHLDNPSSRFLAALMPRFEDLLKNAQASRKP